MSLAGSIIGALVAFAARPKPPGRDPGATPVPNDEVGWMKQALASVHASREKLSQRVEALEIELAITRQAVLYWRQEAERLTQASHLCQHQADLNRAFAAQEARQAFAQGVGLQGQQMANCQLQLHDCNMHRAEMTRMAQRLSPPAP